VVSQKQMSASAQRQFFDLCHTFNEIMSGPNPLTKAEIRRLIAKRPEKYGFLSKWAE
jgi:hypothetical protein